MDLNYQDLAKMIDHSMLSPTMVTEDFENGIQLALAYDVASVCLMPYYVKRCAELLAGSTVQTSTVIGFPHGGHTAGAKKAEAQIALDDGCQELDMVVNINQVLSGNWDAVREDIAAVLEVTRSANQKLKVIFENCYLQDAHKIKLCEICSELNVDWVKTSTGFGTSGATMDDLKLMRKHTADHIAVKAAGGVRDLESLIEVRNLGVNRCGSSRTPGMLDPLREKLGMPPVQIATDSSKENPNYQWSYSVSSSRYPFDAIIFDCDGTLVDSETISMSVLAQCLAPLGLDLEHSDAMQRYAGHDLKVVFAEVEATIKRPLPEDFMADFRKAQLDALRTRLRPIEGAAEVLRSISLPTCVASNAPQNKIRVCLETTGLIEHVDESMIFSAYDVEAWKPDPKLFLIAADQMGVAPERCAVVEDSVYGIEAGQRAGMEVFAFDPHLSLPTDLGDVNRIRRLPDLLR